MDSENSSSNLETGKDLLNRYVECLFAIVENPQRTAAELRLVQAFLDTNNINMSNASATKQKLGADLEMAFDNEEEGSIVQFAT